MSTTTDLIDRFKAQNSLQSDNAAARALKLSRQAISSYRQGIRHAEPETIRALAIALGDDPEIAMLRVQSERETVPARRKAWVRCIERLSAAAALMCLAVYMAIPAQVHASNLPDMSNRTVHIMSNWLRSLIRRGRARLAAAASTGFGLCMGPVRGFQAAARIPLGPVPCAE